MKPFAINSNGIKLFAIKEGKAKWQKGYNKICTSKIQYDTDGELATSAYFNAKGAKQFLCQFYKIKA